jgi:beta-lactamase superfamily II metal-dependent hydrolase
VVTHAQSDHEGGAAAVLDRYPVGLLVDGGEGTATREHQAILAAARRRQVPRTAPDAGQELRAGPLRLEVLWPRREPAERHAGEDPNLRAVVAVLHDGDFDLLLPADAESDGASGRVHGMSLQSRSIDERDSATVATKWQRARGCHVGALSNRALTGRPS